MKDIWKKISRKKNPLSPGEAKVHAYAEQNFSWMDRVMVPNIVRSRSIQGVLTQHANGRSSIVINALRACAKHAQSRHLNIDDVLKKITMIKKMKQLQICP